MVDLLPGQQGVLGEAGERWSADRGLLVEQLAQRSLLLGRRDQQIADPAVGARQHRLLDGGRQRLDLDLEIGEPGAGLLELLHLGAQRGQVTRARAFNATAIGYFITNVFPLRLGELVRIFFVSLAMLLLARRAAAQRG